MLLFCYLHQSQFPLGKIRRTAIVAASIGALRVRRRAKMQLHSDPELEASHAAAAKPSPRKRNSLATRKVTIRITEKIHEQLEAATERPGVGKSMVVEAALAQFLNPRGPENPVRQSFDDIHARFDSLERNLRTIAETVALHARYHLAVMPPLPQQRQREACQLGDERFKVLVEQVDQRVRQGRPLIQETIDRLDTTRFNGSKSTIDEDEPVESTPAFMLTGAGSRDDVSIMHESSAAAAREGGSNSNFRHPSNAFCWPA
jgi:predicted HicB family RNase H-like nuclease